MIPTINPYKRTDPKNRLIQIFYKNRKTGNETVFPTVTNMARDVMVNYNQDEYSVGIVGLSYYKVNSKEKDVYMRKFDLSTEIRRRGY